MSLLPNGRVVHGQAAAATPSSPNILLILTDDQTMDAVAKMPYVSSRPDWISFDQAFIENSLCCPSRATILSGQYDTHTGVQHNGLGAGFDVTQTLGVWLQQAGYQTGLFGKYLNGYPFGRGLTPPPGWNNWQVPYVNVYGQFNWDLNSNGTKIHYGTDAASYAPSVLAGKLNSFITSNAKAGRPFFAEYAPAATHMPWIPSPARKGSFATTPVPHAPNFNEADVSDKPAWIQALPLQSVAAMDNQQRRLWATSLSVDDMIRQIDTTLISSGVANNTVVIFMTDNGFSFGDHRWVRKRCAYEECSRTPLLVRYPGRAPRHDSHLISNVDLASTISDIAGAVPSIPQDGQSFLPLILNQDVPAWRDAVLLHWVGGEEFGVSGRPYASAGFWAVRTDNWKYVELLSGEKELYDEVNDPYELTNHADDPLYAITQADLKVKLDTLRGQAEAGARPMQRAPVPAQSAEDD